MGEYRPRDFEPRGPDRPWMGFAHVMLFLLLIGIWWKPGCERIEGRVARLDRRAMPKARVGQALNSGMTSGVSGRYAAIWLEETGDRMAGWAFTDRLHDTRPGDEVRLWVRPDTGKVVDLKNLTRPRRWWTR